MAPLIIAHRGGAPDAGENTAAAFDSALASNADMLEVDVQQTADGVLIVLHDDEVVLPNGQKRAVAGMPLWQLQSLFPGLLLFDDFLDTYSAHKRTNIDVKGTGFERDLVERLRQRDLLGNVLISATFGSSLRTIKLLAADVELGLSRGQFVSWLGRESQSTIAAHMLRPTLTVQLMAHGRYALADAFMLQYRLIRPWLVRFLHARGFRVFCWTVNDPAIVQELALAGVDGIASDDPERLISALRPE